MGINEREWTKDYAKPRLNYYRSDVRPEMPEEFLELIEKYLLIAPYVTPSGCDNAELLQPTLWHRDLHLNNIYVDLTAGTITDIIDWQGVTVAPLILQARIPRMVRHTSPLPLGWVMPEKPEDYDSMSEKRTG
jgi:hypothetical protein